MGKSYIVGIDAGGTKVSYGLFDATGAIVDKMKHATDATADGETFSNTVIASVRTLLERNQLCFADLLGIGVGMPSFILYDKGYILMTASMPCIKDFAMRDYLQAHLPTRIELDSDANLAALAEHRRGS